MHRRNTWLLSAGILLIAASAFGAPRDKAANKKIDEAINQHYLATDFDKAEAILTGTIKACGEKCSAEVIAKAWMYVGVVRGSGKANLEGATEAFQLALGIDPKVKLDEALATPETKQAFKDAAASVGATPTGGSGGGGSEPDEPDEPDEPEEVRGGLTCIPEVREVQTRRIIPVACTSDEDVAKMELRYKEFGGDKWVTVKMKKKGSGFVGQVPCAATELAGTLKYYVRAKDGSGDIVDGYGTKKGPVEVSIVNSTDEAPPALPGADAPPRCEGAVECPPGLPGCNSSGGGKGWGATCEENSECQSGLICKGGTCEEGGCSSDDDCGGGACVDGVCEDKAGPSGPYKKNWVGLHFAMDFPVVGGDDVCSRESQDNEGFSCFYKGSDRQYVFDPQPGHANKINTGVSLGTMRVLASYDRMLTPAISVGARLGYAFNGGPTPEGGTAFLPFHAEVRGTYWIGDMGQEGPRFFAHLGGGLAQVDAKLDVTIRDCQISPVDQQGLNTTDPDYLGCATGIDHQSPDEVNGRVPPGGQPATQSDPPSTYDGLHPPNQLDAYKKLGQSFVGLGGGVLYAFTANSGLMFDLHFMMMLGSTGLVVEPGLGYVYGF